jgi:methylmalonyl-CoA/ethylmalonyl-CoA epimerase
MLHHIDHVGIAVEDLDSVLAIYRDGLGMEVTHDETVEEQGTRVLFLAAREGPEMELLVALGPDTPVGKFLGKRGPGIHHICYAVPDLERAMRQCAAQGLQLIDESPRIGAKGKRLAFIHPKSAGGVLVELCEVKRHDSGDV